MVKKYNLCEQERGREKGHIMRLHNKSVHIDTGGYHIMSFYWNTFPQPTISTVLQIVSPSIIWQHPLHNSFQSNIKNILSIFFSLYTAFPIRYIIFLL